MISEEKLKQLIKTKKEVYYIYHNCFNYKIMEVRQTTFESNNLVWVVGGDYDCGVFKKSLNYYYYCDYYSEEGGESEFVAYLDEVFETKEDADFMLKFGSIERTECLQLPVFEDFGKSEILFNSENGDAISFLLIQNKIVIYKNFNQRIFYKINNKKNYLDACKYCKSLYLGEKK